jgi:hypothetical protein
VATASLGVCTAGLVYWHSPSGDSVAWGMQAVGLRCVAWAMPAALDRQKRLPKAVVVAQGMPTEGRECVARGLQAVGLRCFARGMPCEVRAEQSCTVLSLASITFITDELHIVSSSHQTHLLCFILYYSPV